MSSDPGPRLRADCVQAIQRRLSLGYEHITEIATKKQVMRQDVQTLLCEVERLEALLRASANESRSSADLEKLVEQLHRIVDGFENEAMNGVICTPPDSEFGGVEWDVEPNRRWCERCRTRWSQLRKLPAQFSALLRASASAPPPTVDEDWATLLGVPADTHVLLRVAAFLRLYAGRIRKHERWDIPETMANAYESAAIQLDTFYANLPVGASASAVSPEPPQQTVDGYRKCVCGHNVDMHEDLDGGTHECNWFLCGCIQFVEDDDSNALRAENLALRTLLATVSETR